MPDFAQPWTPERIQRVLGELWEYIESNDCPTIPEFCYKYIVDRTALYQHEEFTQAKNLLIAKRAAYYENAGRILCKEDGPRGAFICKAVSNAGDFSWTDKSEVEHSGALTIGEPPKPSDLEEPADA